MSALEEGTLHKVQYYETDQMGVVHHSNYIRWFEEARAEWMEAVGLPYAQLEAEGIASPVLSGDDSDLVLPPGVSRTIPASAFDAEK